MKQADDYLSASLSVAAVDGHLGRSGGLLWGFGRPFGALLGPLGGVLGGSWGGLGLPLLPQRPRNNLPLFHLHSFFGTLNLS